MRISSVLTQAGGNFARSTKYSVILTPPSGLSTVYGQHIDTLCKSITLPSVEHTPIEFKIKGQNVKIPGRVQQQQHVDCTFYMDENLDIRSLFQNWIYSMDNRNPVPKNSMSQDMYNQHNYGSMILIAKDFNELSQPKLYIFEDVYPLSVGDTTFSSEDKDTILTLDVSLSFSWYITNSNSSGLMENITDLDIELDKFGQIMYSAGYNYGDLSNYGPFTGIGSRLVGNAIGSMLDNVIDKFF